MKKKLPPPPAGYRWLEVGETIGKHDRLVFGESRLVPTRCVGVKLPSYARGCYVRRLPGRPKGPAKKSAPPGPVWRRLAPGEQVVPGDCMNSKSNASNCHKDLCWPGDEATRPEGWVSACSLVGLNVGEEDLVFFYRRIDQPAAPAPAKSALFLGAPAGYRELNEGETILPTDAYLLAGQWFARRGTKNCGHGYKRGVNRPTVRYVSPNTCTTQPFPAPLGHKFWEPGTPIPDDAWFFHPSAKFGFYSRCSAGYSGRYQREWSCGQVVVPVSQPKPTTGPAPAPTAAPGNRTVVRRHEFGEAEVTRLAKTYNHPDSGFPIAYHAVFARRDGVTTRFALTEVGLAAIVDAFNELQS